MPDPADSLLHLDIGTILRTLAQFRPDPEAQLRRRLLEAQLERLNPRPPIPFVPAPWEAIDWTERTDVIVTGDRGSGKTALAAAIAQASQRPIACIDWPSGPAETIGGRTVSAELIASLPRCVLVLDEARLRTQHRKPEWLWSMIALARQRDHSLIWTAQSTASIAPDILRMDARLAFKRTNPIAARFGREELSDIATAAKTLLDTREGPGATAILDGGQWILTDAPLPAGWTDRVSRLWT